MKTFESESINSAWEKAYIYLKNENHIQKSRAGSTLEIMKVIFSISNSRDRWVTSRVPMISPAFAIAEVFWILDGQQDANFINTWNPILKKFAGNVENYYGAYGNRLIKNFGFNQIEQAYTTLKHNPNTRQAVLNIWDPEKDLPKKYGLPNSDDIPCNLVSMLKIRNNKLEWSQVMRGNDLLRGTPYNFIQFTMLQEIMAGWLDIDIGDYILFTDSLHLYKKDFHKFKLRTEIKKFNANDVLLFSKEEFNTFFPECIKILQDARLNGINNNIVKKLQNHSIIPQEYKNLLSIPLAYLALKSNNIELMNTIEGLCLNQQLLYIWQQWKYEVAYKSQQNLATNT
jgi:thymidylate synthase